MPISENWTSRMGRWKAVRDLKIPQCLCSDVGWAYFVQQMSRNTSICQIRHDDGQMSLVHTSYEHRYDGNVIVDTSIRSILQRNWLIGFATRTALPILLNTTTTVIQTAKKDNEEWNALGFLIEKLGSNRGDGSPVYVLLRPIVADLASLYRPTNTFIH